LSFGKRFIDNVDVITISDLLKISLRCNYLIIS
jgi:hypothetical protein